MGREERLPSAYPLNGFRLTSRRGKQGAKTTVNVLSSVCNVPIPRFQKDQQLLNIRCAGCSEESGLHSSSIFLLDHIKDFGSCSPYSTCV